MKHLAENLKQTPIRPRKKLECLYNYLRGLLSSIFHILLFRVNPFWIQLGYFLVVSLFGFVALKALDPRKNASISPTNFDIFFTSVSSTTVSSMATVEMETFSNTQLAILTILMFVGGEVFTSMLGLHFRRFKMNQTRLIENKADSSHNSDSSSSDDHHDHIELVLASDMKIMEMESKSILEEESYYNMKSKSLKTLACLVLFYLLVVHVTGFILISMYFSLVSSAREILIQKGLNTETFSLMAVVSTFTNCGFLPTNENMMVFKKNPGLQLILIPQVLMGNTMYAVFLHLTIIFMAKITDRAEFKYILKNSRELGYGHLFSGMNSLFLGITGLGFILVQLVVFCSIEWNSEITSGLSVYEKLVASLFQVVNARHTGESVFDLSAVSTSILVIFVVTMYLPPYTVFLPIKEAEKISSSEGKANRRKKDDFWGNILLSQLSYLVIFIILICIIERENIKRDPLNFNVLNIVVEVISAYGNVGFSIGYSCDKRINTNGYCKNEWLGFVGRWSNEGKFVLIVVMFFGRLKTFNLNGGRAWTVL